MNQKVVIYIILSAILLYLYYRKKDFTIFVAFAVWLPLVTPMTHPPDTAAALVLFHMETCPAFVTNWPP